MASSSTETATEPENTKVIIQNLKNYAKPNRILAALEEWGVPSGKLNKPNGVTFGYITLKTKEEAEKAIELINGKTFEDQKIVAKFANKGGVLGSSAKRSFDGDGEASKRSKGNAQTLSESVIPNKTAADAVTPLWKIPYETQLEQKSAVIKSVLSSIVKAMKKSDTEHRSILQKWNIDKGMCCSYDGITPSPIQNHYRNKNEFTIGLNAESKPVVGFQLGNYSDGIIAIGEPDECLNVSVEAKALAKAFTEFIRTKSKLQTFNKVTHVGFWRLLTVRQGFRTNEVMAILQCKVENIEPSVVDDELANIQKFLKNKKKKGLKLTSLLFQEHNGVSNMVPADAKTRVLLGQNFITEEMCGLKFQISPGAFFQVNTPAAEVLYNMILEKAELNASSTFLDVCCGTGTIGLAAARHVKNVIGVELSAPAIEDAKRNMNLNGIENAKFQCAKAEDVMQELLVQNRSEDLIAVVDPPRSGVHVNVTRALRAAKNITRIVYVSCNPEAGLLQNAIELCRSPSNRFTGEPFVPVSACAVDLFPHTKHCEAIMIFERASRVVKKEKTSGAESSSSTLPAESEAAEPSDAKTEKKAVEEN